MEGGWAGTLPSSRFSARGGDVRCRHLANAAMSGGSEHGADGHVVPELGGQLAGPTSRGDDEVTRNTRCDRRGLVTLRHDETPCFASSSRAEAVIVLCERSQLHIYLMFAGDGARGRLRHAESDHQLCGKHRRCDIRILHVVDDEYLPYGGSVRVDSVE